MPCVRPLKAYRTNAGGVTFRVSEGFSDQPLVLPCGRCLGCRVEKRRTWALRCVHEAKMHERNCFVTLTYSPQHLPEDCSLDVRTWQLFAKRLRETVGNFRFFMCGEYGDASLRPHYHALLFGMDFHDDRLLLKVTDNNNKLYTSALLDKVWGKGFCTIGQLTYQSAAYVARYCMKKASGPLRAERYKRVRASTGEEWEVVPEFSLMSRRPGIGRAWFDKWRSDVFPSDEIIFEGKKYRVPKYYDSCLERVDPGAALTVKALRRSRMREREHLYGSKVLEAKEYILESKERGSHGSL